METGYGVESHVQPQPALPIGSRRRPGVSGWDTLIILDGALLAFIAVATLVLYFVGLASPPAKTSAPDNILLLKFMLWFTIATNFVLLGVVPVVWALLTRVGGWKGAMAYLDIRMRTSYVASGAVIGVGLAGVAVLIEVGLELMGYAPETQGGIMDLLVALDWPLVIATSLVAGVAEEIAFRGVLQKYTGMWGQAGIFAVFHLANAGVLAFIVTGLIGLLFGYLVRRGHSLVVVIMAHFVYDLILLGAVLVFPELAAGEPGVLT